jgi:hypothetical protein
MYRDLFILSATQEVASHGYGNMNCSECKSHSNTPVFHCQHGENLPQRGRRFDRFRQRFNIVALSVLQLR